MRKSVIGICVSVPLAFGLLACSSTSDDTSGNAGGAGSANGGAHNGGASNGGTSNGGTSSAGTSNGGSLHSGGSGGTSNAGSASGGGAGTSDTGSAGEAGAGPSAPTVQSAVYTMSNAAAGNAIYGFTRASDGSLTPMPSSFPTAGNGSGAGLGEQGALAYDLENKRIYAVNAGDNSFSIFAVKDDGSLSAAVNVTTAGFGTGAAALLGPKSVTFHGDTVYVLYEGSATVPSMIAGYALEQTGGTISATAIASSNLHLSSATQGVDPAQIEFTPDGKWLVVTEKQSGAAGAVKGAGMIDTFAVDHAGLATLKDYYATAKVGTTDMFQSTPFGFEFQGDTLVVSEAGVTGVGAYTYANGVIAPVGGVQFLPTDPAPCWVAFSHDFAYVANAQGPSISGFTVAANGELSDIGPIAKSLVASTGKTITGPSGPVNQGPTDEFVSQDGKFLYVLDSAVPAIGIFEIAENGTLSRVGTDDYSPALTALPKGAAGIIAR
ncbi:MAG TPA: beta-propeller fold lactonase family protein [Polyangiaceae bacterium]|jgi:6-phosphogluconolactonase|nr:beta-propeller fold lactonase family protein [Polyangiaceae bacterium]